jgi:hypothetical protein
MNEGIPSRELSSLIRILEPDQRLTLHVERGHENALIKRSTVIIKELLYLVRPPPMVESIKSGEIKAQSSGVRVYKSLPPIRFLILLLTWVSSVLSISKGVKNCRLWIPNVRGIR